MFNIHRVFLEIISLVDRDKGATACKMSRSDLWVEVRDLFFKASFSATEHSE